MELWLRKRQADSLHSDLIVDVSSQDEWADMIRTHQPISSILWPKQPLFRPQPASETHVFRRRHPHEINYRHDEETNRSYRDAACALAKSIEQELTGAKVLVYAPLRGALPIWKAISGHLDSVQATLYLPVTSSFVFYPVEFGIFNHKRKPASGRFANILELKRLRPLLSEYDSLLYVDEIVSGSMMYAHLKEMIMLNVHKHLHICAAGLADAFGSRSVPKRELIQKFESDGKLRRFLWEGCHTLITEDQKFLHGRHYVDYDFGPNVVPVLTDELTYFQEKIAFEAQVFGEPESVA